MKKGDNCDHDDKKSKDPGWNQLERLLECWTMGIIGLVGLVGAGTIAEVLDNNGGLGTG